MTPATGDIPIFPRGVRLHYCKIRQCWFLLAPESALKLDPVGLAILREIDGRHTLAEISNRLADMYQAPLDKITSDVVRFIGDLTARRVIDVQGVA